MQLNCSLSSQSPVRSSACRCRFMLDEVVLWQGFSLQVLGGFFVRIIPPILHTNLLELNIDLIRRTSERRLETLNKAMHFRISGRLDIKMLSLCVYAWKIWSLSGKIKRSQITGSKETIVRIYWVLSYIFFYQSWIENSSHLVCDVVLFGEYIQTFRTIATPSFSGSSCPRRTTVRKDKFIT